MLELFMLGSMAFTAGFATGWTLKTVARYRPNCHSDNSGDSVAAQGLREREEIVELKRHPWTFEELYYSSPERLESLYRERMGRSL